MEPDEAQHADPRLTAAIVASALFMQNLDGTVVTTALPAMARDFGDDPVHLSVAITSYLIALTVFIPASGWVAEKFGARRVFMWAIAIFAGSSAICGAADGLGVLVLARILQGVGGAMMVPVGRLLLLRRVRKDELLTAMTWLTMPALLGPVMGPPLGGFLADNLSWRWVFWINLPVGLIGLLLVGRFIKPMPPGEPGRLDVPGMTLIGGSLALLMAGMETLGRGSLPIGLPEALLVIGAVMAWAGWRHCKRVEHPAVDFSLLRIPTFAVPNIAGSLFRIGAGATPFLVPLSLQLGFGLSASISGMVSFATALGAMVMKPIARWALRSFGFRTVLVANGVIGAILVAALMLVGPSWPLAAIFVLLFAGGLARSLEFTAHNTLAFADVPQPRLSAATSFYGTTQQLTLAMGVTVAAATLQFTTNLAGRTDPTTADFMWGFGMAGLMTLLSVPICAGLAPDAGASVSGHRHVSAAQEAKS